MPEAVIVAAGRSPIGRAGKGSLVDMRPDNLAMLVLFGARPASQVLAAVVIYRVISLWVPAVLGSLAFLSLRREIAKPLAPPLAG